jgi:hypothetical protein
MNSEEKEPQSSAEQDGAAPDPCELGGGETPVQGVTAKEGGAKRSSYWKRRDYDQVTTF